MSKKTKLSEFRIWTVRECNGLVVLHLEHESGQGRTKRRFADYGEAGDFIRKHKIRGEL